MISVFLPFTGHITDHYTKDQRYSAIEFSSGKWNGSKFLNVVRRSLIRFVERHGGRAVAPNIDPRYDSDDWRPFWSERHTAFAAVSGAYMATAALSVSKYLEFFRKKEVRSVLDYGAGTLRNSAFMAEAGFRVYAADLPVQVARIMKMASARKLAGVLDVDELAGGRLDARPSAATSWPPSCATASAPRWRRCVPT
ncbi:hypothetical protein M1B72_07060 [Geomonas paludis]|uniref:Uncharacterized protein n=1 Tax=Geomonas paludis TaxID=2740185 RepID=A0A6V8MUV7_9BACT|nr:hypothetical protein [Geomonas paludis]UPU37459.1 hypothetical protein M1B72_07060 [Geomonas paludis]GFO63975.1 hypothetical protein GMPD_18940 [Geomonas paludis]